MSRILLITPLNFYNYSERLKNALEERSHSVHVLNDEYPANFIGKVIGYLDLPLSRLITRYVIGKKLRKSGQSYDIVFIVKGRGISTKLLLELRKSCQQIIAYNFDSFAYYSHPIRWMDYVDKYYSFDFDDCKNYNLPRLDLYSSINVCDCNQRRVYDVSAIVRNHSNRVKFIHDVCSSISGSVFIHIYEKNIFSYLINFIANPKYMWALRKHISFEPISFEKYQSILLKSKATIDYAHPKQSGITIRCWEALSIGTKIISNNRNLTKCEHFGQGTFLIYDPIKNKDVLCEFIEGRMQSYSRSIANFLDEINF